MLHFSHDKARGRRHGDAVMILRLLTPSSRARSASPSPPSEAASLCLKHLGIETPIEIKRSARSRRYALRVSLTRRAVILTLPLRADLKKASLFAHSHAEWIRQKLAALPQSVPLCDGSHVLFKGVRHRIRAHGRKGAHVVIDHDADGHPLLDVPGDPAFCARRLRDFLQRQAREALQIAVTHYATALDVTVTGLTLRDSKSRWGSCSATGRLNFSWRLIMAPPFVLDYLAAHEITHRREMNHGPRFWRLLDTLTPHVQSAETWLKTDGPDLHRYGAPDRSALDLSPASP